MTDHLNVSLTEGELGKISTLGLAHVGDAVYELLVRSWLCARGNATSKGLHRSTVALVRASAQAEAAEKLAPALTEEERAVFRRGRNAKVNTVPKNAVLSQYHAATGLETLFGWLWLRGDRERINDLFSIITEE